MTTSVDIVITNATVITMDAAGTVLQNATIAVQNGAITVVASDVTAPPAIRTVDAHGGLVLPGLINAHAHLAMTMFRGLADDVDLDGFLARLVPAEGAVLSGATVAAGTALAVAECLRSGITSVLDMYFFHETSAVVAAEAGLRLHTGPVFVEFPGADRRRFDDRIAWATDCVDAAEAMGLGAWLCPHSSYLLDEHQLARIGELAATRRTGVHTHACETVAELAQVRARHGRSPIETFRDSGLLGPRTVLAHGVHLTDADIAIVAEHGTAVTHCPASNQKLASGIAPVPDLLAADITVALGTDGSASGNDLDLWLAMRLAAYTQTAVNGAGAVTAGDVLRMATIGGARALGVDHLVGSIEVGKRADIVVLDASSPSLTPVYDPVSAAAYAAGRGDVRHVLVDGRLVVEDRLLTTIDVDAAIGGVAALRPSIEAALR